MKIGIIILSWNSKQYIDECLTGLLKHESSDVYVVDNGSTDGSPDYIAQNYPTINLTVLPVNVGFALGNNIGIEKALKDGCDGVFLLNNDTIIDESFLEPCVNILLDNPQIGIAGPVVVEAYEPQIIQSAGGKISLWTLGFPFLGEGERFVRRDYMQPVGYVLGCAMLIRREVILQTGGLDPEYFPAYVEEADLCHRSRLLGYNSVVTYAARVRHIGKKSSGGSDTAVRRFHSNQFRFGMKHLHWAQFLIAGHLLVWEASLKKLLKSVGYPIISGTLRRQP